MEIGRISLKLRWIRSKVGRYCLELLSSVSTSSKTGKNTVRTVRSYCIYDLIQPPLSPPPLVFNKKNSTVFTDLFAGEPAEHHDAAEKDLQPRRPHTGGRTEPLQHAGRLDFLQ